MLVDGAVVDNMPIGLVAELGEGPLIAVDVRATTPSGDRRPDGEIRLPSLGETLMRTVLFGSADTRAAAQRHADLVITPAGEGIGLLEFHQIDRAIESGRRAAHEALDGAPGHLFG